MLKKGTLATLFVFFALIMLSNFYIPKITSATDNYCETVMEVNSERVLYENNGDKKLPMASTTKILTALIIIEDCDLQSVVEIPAEACAVEGSSVYLKAGEKYKVSDLLYGLMLRSGNDCAVALALYHSKSIDAFARVMNERAKSLGAINGNFTNPHGLPNENHYTTAKDLCKISCAAMRNEIFKDIVSTKSVNICDCDTGKLKTLVNKNKFLYKFDGANGVKTGYTKVAGRCLVSGAKRGETQLVAVVLNCKDMYERSAEILEATFKNYKYRQVYKPQKIVLSTDVDGKKVKAKAENSFYYPLREDEINKLKIEYNMPEFIKLPVKKDEVVGEMQILLENQLLFSQKIVSIETVTKSVKDILREIAKKQIF